MKTMLRFLQSAHVIAGLAAAGGTLLAFASILAAAGVDPDSALRGALNGLWRLAGAVGVLGLLSWTLIAVFKLMFVGGGDHDEARAGILWGPSTYRGDNNDAPPPPDHTDF